MRIGGISFLISADSAIRLRIANPLYHPFLAGEEIGEEFREIKVQLKNDTWPQLDLKGTIFNTLDSWFIRRNGKDYWIHLAPPHLEEPLWIARFGSRVQRVTVYCRSLQHKKSEKRIVNLPITYPLDQLLLMVYLARRQGMLMHAAGMVHRESAYLFAGASGAGKSTFSELLVKARTGKMLSDERMIVREIGGKMIAFGTPWAGTAGIARDGSAPLAGIFFLKHGKSNRIEKLAASAAADRLLPMISIPWYDPDTAAPIIAFAKRVFAVAPAYEFRFTPDRTAIAFFWKFIKKNPDYFEPSKRSIQGNQPLVGVDMI